MKIKLFIPIIALLLASVSALIGSEQTGATATDGTTTCTKEDIVSSTGAISFFITNSIDINEYYFTVGHTPAGSEDTHAHSSYRDKYVMFMRSSDLGEEDAGTGLSAFNYYYWAIQFSSTTCAYQDGWGDGTTPSIYQTNAPILLDVIYYREGPGAFAPDVAPQVGYNIDDQGLLSALITERVMGGVGQCSNVHWTLYDDTSTIVHEANLEEYDQFQYSPLSLGEYLLRVEYTGGSPPCAPLGDEYVPVEIVINYLGAFTLGSTVINECTFLSGVLECEEAPVYTADNCFIDEFPWVQIDDCKRQIDQFVHSLSFGTISVTNDYDIAPECHNLGTLGDWINLPDQELCPAFSDEIRAVVTPFVTLILGLTAISFLARDRGGV